MNRHKLKAFTLSEMIVVMLLTAIVAGLAFSVLRLVQQQMKAIKSNYDKVTAFHKLEQSLWIDFHRSEVISFSEASGVLRCDSITYHIQPTGISKEQDTFYLGVKEVVPFFKGEQKVHGEAVDALKIAFDSLSGNRILFVYKTLTTKDLLE